MFTFVHSVDSVEIVGLQINEQLCFEILLLIANKHNR